MVPLTSRRRPARAAVARWLQAGGSLSARLQQALPPFGVQVLRQGRGMAWPGETRSLGLPAQAALHVREVLLHGAGQPVVFARSVTSRRAAAGPWRSICGLGSQPLAAMLFSRHDIVRSPLLLQWWPARHPAVRAIARAWLLTTGEPLPAHGLWVRHSVFRRRGAGLRVCECFLPGEVSRWPGPDLKERRAAPEFLDPREGRAGRPPGPAGAQNGTTSVGYFQKSRSR